MSNGEEEPMATVRVLGMPSDTTEEHFSRWFLFAKGFSRATLTADSLKGLIGFVRFTSSEAARVAINALDGRTLSSAEALGGVVTLSADLANINLRLTHDSSRPFSELEAQPDGAHATVSVSGSGEESASNVLIISNLSPSVSDRQILGLAGRLPGFSELTWNSADDTMKSASLHFDSIDSCTRAMPYFRNSALATADGEKLDCQFAAASTSPSDALIIRNLSPDVLEQEIYAVLSTFPGFKHLSYTWSGDDKGSVAIVHFTSVDNCASAVHAVHGSAMPGAPTRLLSCDFYDENAGSETLLQGGVRVGGYGQSNNTLRITGMPEGYSQQDLSELISSTCSGFMSLTRDPRECAGDEVHLVRFSTEEEARVALDILSANLCTDAEQHDNFKIEFAEDERDLCTNEDVPTNSHTAAYIGAVPSAKHPSLTVSQLQEMDLALQRELACAGATMTATPKYSSPAVAPAVAPILTNLGGGIKKANFPVVTGLPNSCVSVERHQKQQQQQQQQQLQQQQQQHHHHQPIHQAPSTRFSPSPDGRCSTVFCSYLLRNCSEEELSSFFQVQCEGFVRMKFASSSSSKGGMCWVRYDSVEHAEAAIAALLNSSFCASGDPTKSLQVDFAKNDLDCRGVDQRTATPQETTQALLGNPACDTLFLGALSSDVSEEEMLSCLALLPGFQRLKYVTSGHRPVAFAQFDSTDSCSQAIHVLHGSAFPSAPNQAIDCQFARNSLNSKRPRTGTVP